MKQTTPAGRPRSRAPRPTEQPARDELGAHVSVAGGVHNAPARAAEIGSHHTQVFTKQPNRWAEPTIEDEIGVRFRDGRGVHGIAAVASHDSYLINLATPDPELFARSLDSFRRELERCRALGIEYLVTHPGNATDSDFERGLAQNAEAIERALDEVPGETVVLLETTAGSGRVLGASFEQLAVIRGRIREPLRSRVGVCFDTCHVWAAGYDLVGDYAGVMARFEDVLGAGVLRLFHMNDSKFGQGSRRDRHAGIAEGTLGEAPFRALMTDERFRAVPKILETPKGDDLVTLDRENLARLRRFRAEG